MQVRAHNIPQTHLETLPVPAAKDLSHTSSVDAGCRPSEYYRSRLSPVRFASRQLILSLVEKETEPLGRWQAKVRTPLLDAYFSLTATLGSHTFYVLMLPIPVWFGYFKLARDLVFILGFGIYFSGLLKDYLCLPRPKSPPLHRITRSHYTAQEYGCPSSHSANAISVTLTLATYWYHYSYTYSTLFNTVSIIFGLIYLVSLVLGRLYCGMHGFVDVGSGLVIGISCFLIRHLTSDIWDHIVFQTGWFSPVLVLVFYYSLIYFHVKPIDDCPCFEDSVAFVGVLTGMELGQWALFQTSNAITIEDFDFRYNVIVPFSWTHLGPFFTLARLVIGVSTIVIWKAISKPLLTRLLSPITPHRASHHCKALQSRTHVYIFVRLAVYAGISTLTVWMNVLFTLFGLDSSLSGPQDKYT